MMKRLFLILSVLFSLSLTACSSEKKDTMNFYNPRSDGKVTDPNKKPDPSGPTALDRLLARSVNGHRISHEIFSELWMHIWEDRMSRPNSIFNELQQIIESHRDLKTNHFNLKNIQCPERMTQFAVIYKAGSKTDIVSVNLQVADCADMKNPKWRDAAVATVQDSKTTQWDIFSQFFPRGAGKHLSGDATRSKCVVENLDDKRLASLSCEYIGQSRDNETHLLFTEMDFDRDSEVLVVAKGKKYQNSQEACDDPKYCTVIKVPAQGTIEIIENVNRPESKEAEALAQIKGDEASPARSEESNSEANLEKGR